jgi:hypothetical protein
MNSIPPFVINLISFFIGAPAALARFLGIVLSCLEGIIVLTGNGGAHTPLLSFGLYFGGHPGLAVAAFCMSILGYLMEVLLAYITAEDRQALPPRTIAVLMGAEAAIQSLAVITVCLLAAAGFRDDSNLYFGVAGSVTAVVAGLLFFRFNRRILEWRAAWQRPPASWPED